MRHGQPLHHLGDGERLGAVGLEEFQPRRRGRKQFADLDARTRRRSRGRDLPLDACIDQDREAAQRAGRAGGDREPADRTDRGQGLAAKAQRHDRHQIAVGQLGGGVTLDGEREILRRHAATVVDDAQQPAPTGLDLHGDRARAGVDGVLDQFLHGRGRPLHHLAGGDAVDQHGVEPPDVRRGGVTIVASGLGRRHDGIRSRDSGRTPSV